VKRGFCGSCGRPSLGTQVLMRLISDFTAAIRLRRNTIAMEGQQLSTPRAYKRSPAFSMIRRIIGEGTGYALAL